MQTPDRRPFTNMRFRIEIEGMQGTGAVEVVFPDARIVAGPRKVRATQYGTLILRRGLTRSSEWYDWWSRARSSARGLERTVLVGLLDERGKDAIRWTFTAAKPLGYIVSNLNALGNETLIESLELAVGEYEASFAPAPVSRKRR
jgi:phage tail-like protein